MMEDSYLSCNIPTCRKQLIEKAWVTRCLHVFCLEHGQMNFLVPSHQISCPVCDTINSKEVDIICCETTPHEMFLSGVHPEKALHLASISVKLWSRQIQREKNYYVNHLNNAVKKLQFFRNDSQKHFAHTKSKLENQLFAVQKAYNDIAKKYNETKNELESTRLKLHKYQTAYNSATEKRDIHANEGFSHWFGDDHQRDASPYFSALSNPPSREFPFMDG